jgi:vacuolar-type H+-ATPase subunit H
MECERLWYPEGMDRISREHNQHRRPKPGSPEAIKEAQRIIRQFIPEGVSLADELIAERRLEAERE